MRPNTRLKILRVSADHRISRLRLLVSPLGPPSNSHADRTLAYAVIEAHTLWSSFLRSLYLSIAFNARTESGFRITTGVYPFPTSESAIKFAVTTLKPRGNEPAWHDTQVLLKLTRAIGASNQAQIRSAFAYPSNFYSYLTTVRNFFAHRSHSGRLKIETISRNLGFSGGLRAADLLVSRGKGRPQNVITDWLDDIQSVVQLACQ